MRLGRKGSVRIFTAVLAGAMLLTPYAWAQHSSTDDGARKVKSRVAPVYPDLAKRMAVTGKVKIEVVIAPDGTVKRTRVVGGHPLLVNPAVDAVKEWKFNTGAEETTQIVVFEFKSTDKTD
ncbi:MAG TPA: energy transducer TonB [Candidatus Dormibacteraeota bacterium]|nr:energy transducer TonB [Candidatus Dormibacteraeota bacterium]